MKWADSRKHECQSGRRWVNPFYIFLFLLFDFALFGAAQANAAIREHPIVVVIPSYNNKDWYRRNLDSVFSQKYRNFRVVYIDDASEDTTGTFVRNYIEEKGLKHKCTLVQNTKRRGALANVYKGIWLCDPKEIVVNLDGDDWLAHDEVLAYLNEVYRDQEIWVTYGQFAYYPCNTPGWAAQVPVDVIERNAFREYPWVTTALRTFYAGLFQKIKKEDLLLNGDFFTMAGDLAYMWPILEMAGRHSRFIPEVLYIYNVDTPINDIKKDSALQQTLGFITRDRKRYVPIKKPY